MDNDKERKGGRSRGAKEFLQKEIGFNRQQLLQYDSLNKQHHKKGKAAFDEMRNNKEQQFKELGAGAFNDSAVAGAILQSAEKQKVMELQFFNHLREIRKLCTAEQLPKFDSLCYKMWNRRGDNKKKQEEKK
jgi:hypothetical protein